MLGMFWIRHVYDMYTICIRQFVPIPANIQQLGTAIEEQWTKIPQATNQQTDQLYAKEM